MEKEKAIEILNALAWVQGGPGREEIITAISMAIKALQVEPAHGRLIDADALYASIAKDTYLLTDRINSKDYGMFLVGIKEKIDNAPTVQADRPHGEWIEEYTDANGDKWYRCSHCGERFVLIEKGEASTEPYHFCPICCADMRKRREI